MVFTIGLIQDLKLVETEEREEIETLNLSIIF